MICDVSLLSMTACFAPILFVLLFRTGIHVFVFRLGQTTHRTNRFLQNFDLKSNSQQIIGKTSVLNHFNKSDTTDVIFVLESNHLWFKNPFALK